MYQRLKLTLDRRFASIRDMLDYIDTHFTIMKLDETTLDSIEQLVRSLTTDEKKELLETIIRIRLRRISSKL
jgi:hypothetical protein